MLRFKGGDRVDERLVADFVAIARVPPIQNRMGFPCRCRAARKGPRIKPIEIHLSRRGGMPPSDSAIVGATPVGRVTREPNGGYPLLKRF